MTEIVTPKGKQVRSNKTSSQKYGMSASTQNTTPVMEGTARKAIVPFKLLTSVEPKESPMTPSCLDKTETSTSSANRNAIAAQQKAKKKGYRLLHIDFKQNCQGQGKQQHHHQQP